MLPTIAIVAAVVVVAYLAGRYIKPLGKLYTDVFGLAGKIFADIELGLDRLRFKIDEENAHPGLHTTVIVVTLLLAVVALTSGTWNTLQALPTLFPDASLTLPSVPSWFNFAMGGLFFSVNALFGSLWLEGKEAVPKEARIFNAGKFGGFILFSFVLSLLASVAFYGLKVVFLMNPDSNVTHLLQLSTFLALGILEPCIGVVALYILALGVLSLLRIPVTVVWCIAHLATDLFEYMSLVFSGSDIRIGVRDKIVGTVVYVRDTSVTLTHAQEQKENTLPTPQEPQALPAPVEEREYPVSTLIIGYPLPAPVEIEGTPSAVPPVEENNTSQTPQTPNEQEAQLQGVPDALSRSRKKKVVVK